MDAQAKAPEIYAQLEEARLGTVLAVWKDGGVSFEGLGFQGRRTGTGSSRSSRSSPARDSATTRSASASPRRCAFTVCFPPNPGSARPSSP